MSSTSSAFSSTQLFQDFLGKFHSRKLLIHNSLNQPTITVAPPPPHPAASSSLHKNVLMIVSVLICSLIFTVGLNFLIGCTLRFLRSTPSDSRTNAGASQSIKKGIKKKIVKTFPVVNYSAELKFPGLDTECAICLSDFLAGERVLLLPKCNHGFHVLCIDKWLRSNTSCPRCRECVIETCEKIVACSKQASSSSEHSMPVQETVVKIRPLEPEGILRNSEELS